MSIVIVVIDTAYVIYNFVYTCVIYTHYLCSVCVVHE